MKQKDKKNSRFGKIPAKREVSYPKILKHMTLTVITPAVLMFIVQAGVQLVQADVVIDDVPVAAHPMAVAVNSVTNEIYTAHPGGLRNQTANSRTEQSDINGPAGSGKFGQKVIALPNGNIIVTDPNYSIPSGAANVGAIYLYDGSNGNLISTLTGSTAFDLVGSGGITVLTNGNYVISSPSWDGKVMDAGAFTFGNGTTGVSGAVSAANSLVGSNAGGDANSPQVLPLSNGNYLVRSPGWTKGGANKTGAVTFGSGTSGVSGVVSASNSLVGSSAYDSVGGGGVKELSNGNYVVISSKWGSSAGAVTFGNGTTGISGMVSISNSLIGSTSGDFVGRGGVTVLSNGNYVVSSPTWNGIATDVGAVTFGDGMKGISGVVSASNSLVGSTAGDHVGGTFIDQRTGRHYIGLITALSNGNYVVGSPLWDGAEPNVGAVTFGSGTNGISGEISALNSLTGSTAGDRVGVRRQFLGTVSAGVTALANGNYVVSSPAWNGIATDVGAVTFGTGASGVSGVVSASNSLVGSSAYDSVGGGGVKELSNGNYVVGSPWWDGAEPDVGAVTFGDGTTGVTGFVSVTNSLVGSTALDFIGSSGVTELSNGNYVVSSPTWNGIATNVGAVTFGNGMTGVTGMVSPANSLVGSTAEDGVGFGGVTALSNGNYVVNSFEWDGTAVNVGAVTFGDGMKGISGVVSAANSLVGSTANDTVGGGGVTALSNGNFIVYSILWDGAAVNTGAVTWGNGATGISGAVSPANSLVGSAADDRVGLVRELTNGNYVVISPGCDNGAATDAGAVTFGNGTTETSGAVSPANSLVGSTAADRVGDGGVTELPNGGYVVFTYRWDNGGIVDAGAISYLSGPTGKFTPISSDEPKNRPDFRGQTADVSNLAVDTSNSVMGTTTGGGIDMNFSFDAGNNQLVVGRPADNIVTLFRIVPANSKRFDFDGDGKTDIGVWRPGQGEWWYLRSSDSVARASQFGNSTDKIVPADFTGDGKTDIAFFRDGDWFVLRSEDSSFFSFPFGTANDIPAPGDFDGDGTADPSVFRPASATWFILTSSGGTTIQQFGSTGDIPIVEDYDGDGKDDIAVFRPSVSEWFLNRSTGGFIGFSFGAPGDTTPAPADFTGDGKADIAFFKPSTSEWFVLRSEDSSFFAFPFGSSGDIPVAGDYDGDGTADPAVFRPSNSTWFLNQSTNGSAMIQFGAPGDVPLPGTRVVP